jgi:hypothetical protein
MGREYKRRLLEARGAAQCRAFQLDQACRTVDDDDLADLFRENTMLHDVGFEWFHAPQLIKRKRIGDVKLDAY